jgi:hypothetical protein
MKPFYNTTGENGTTLDQFTYTASEQQSKILEWVNKHPDRVFCREDLRHLFHASVPVTSIVRAICNLRDLGEIEVVGKTMGTQRRPIFTYRKVVK